MINPLLLLIAIGAMAKRVNAGKHYLMKTAIRFLFTARELEIQQVIGCRLRRLL